MHVPDPTALEYAFQGRFKPGRVLGTGGQGTVYLAKRPIDSGADAEAETVALKIYRDPQQDQRVEREIAAMERIRHWSLAALIEHGSVSVEDSEFRYIAWEFVDGSPLFDRLREGPLPPALVAAIGRDISGAIAALWEQRIVHRDIKPANIMLRKGRGEAVLIDLGFARHLAEPSLTAHGATYGTPGYMSPEHARYIRQLTCKSDVFALGVVLQESLTGVHPTLGRQEGLQLSAPRTAECCPKAPAALAEVIDRMLLPRPAFRPDPEELVRRFAKLAESL